MKGLKAIAAAAFGASLVSGAAAANILAVVEKSDLDFSRLFGSLTGKDVSEVQGRPSTLNLLRWRSAKSYRVLSVTV